MKTVYSCTDWQINKGRKKYCMANYWVWVHKLECWAKPWKNILNSQTIKHHGSFSLKQRLNMKDVWKPGWGKFWLFWSMVRLIWGRPWRWRRGHSCCLGGTLGSIAQTPLLWSLVAFSSIQRFNYNRTVCD